MKDTDKEAIIRLSEENERLRREHDAEKATGDVLLDAMKQFQKRAEEAEALLKEAAGVINNLMRNPSNYRVRKASFALHTKLKEYENAGH